MKRSSILLFWACLLFVACQNEGKQARDESSMDSMSENLTDFGITANKLPYVVQFDERTQNLSLVQTSKIREKLKASDMVRLLNAKYARLQLQLIRTSQDTAFLKIDDANQLTQSMGSAGAQAYLAELTFALTEVSGIKHVKLDFQEGDHAMPGVYQRSDFQDLIK